MQTRTSCSLRPQFIVRPPFPSQLTPSASPCAFFWWSVLITTQHKQAQVDVLLQTPPTLMSLPRPSLPPSLHLTAKQAGIGKETRTKAGPCRPARQHHRQTGTNSDLSTSPLSQASTKGDAKQPCLGGGDLLPPLAGLHYKIDLQSPFT